MARAAGEAPDVHVALLRGVNVGGKNRLPMTDLVGMLEAAGCRGVKTYIQSGNAVFRATGACVKGVPGAVTKAIADRFGFRAPLILRTSADLRAVASGNPFLREGADPDWLHVAFLTDAPPAAKIAALDPHRSPPDVFAVRGREIYLHLPNGAGRTKLSNDYFERKLGTTSTLRNWRTVLKLVEMTEAPVSFEAANQAGAGGGPRRATGTRRSKPAPHARAAPASRAARPRG